MGTLETWRKAYGALKDSTKVGLAKVNSEFKDLDVGIVKATNHVECPPKERHVRKIFDATSIVRPRSDVAYCIHALGRRLAKTRNWIVALKTLIVIHRILREGDSTFREELTNCSRRGHILQLSNFKDDSSPLAWDCSAWVRTYALFLEERLECFRVLKYDIEAERLNKSHQGPAKSYSRTRGLSTEDLLEQLPALQQLLYRLVGCQPEGAAFGNYLVQYALALVLKESFKIYCAINDGIINLVDVFFEMSRHEALKALDVYKRAVQQAENLSDFYDFCKGLELARNFQFPILRQPPPSFLATMEEYIKEAPRTLSGSSKKLEYQEPKLLTFKQEDPAPVSPKPLVEPQPDKTPVEEIQEEKPTEAIKEITRPTGTDTGDLLGLEELNANAALIEESNALALAIVSNDEATKPSKLDGLLTSGSTGWELALVSTEPSSSKTYVDSKLAGGFDKLLLDSLYDDAEARKQQQPAYGVAVSPNPFDPHDPFAMSTAVAPPTNVQMAMMAQQQQQMMMMTMMQQEPYPQQQQQQQHQQQQPLKVANPFGDPFNSLSSIPSSRPFTNTNLL